MPKINNIVNLEMVNFSQLMFKRHDISAAARSRDAIRPPYVYTKVSVCRAQRWFVLGATLTCMLSSTAMSIREFLQA